ncbi:TetR/AcrR family transcriptional regulator [Aestuariivirga sp.]|uniref:TetR/AcrR family transcriptional regulator n=1 Tax=Aestuariivirga sp. TaxID=2650926 RepID=UPI0039E32EFA
MAKQTDKKRGLRDRLLTAARRIIAEKGLSSLKAREVAEAAGSALGGLYTVFPDLDGLVMAVNHSTFETLNARMDEASEGVSSADMHLQRLAEAYLAFARAEPHLWRAMFEHRLPDGKTFPSEHYESLNHLMAHIVGPLKALQPALSEEALFIRARTLFSAFHGVISMSLDRWFTGVTGENLDVEVSALLRQLVAGMRQETQNRA